MKRWISLLYGTLVYVLFLGAFLYLLGFLASLVVPKAINDGPVRAFWPSVLVDVALVALFGVQHAVMARPWFKRRITRVIPKSTERSTFVLAASVCVILMCSLWQPLPTTLWHFENPFFAAALTTVSLAGWGLLLVGTFLIDHFELFGLRQPWSAFMGREIPTPRFQTPGPYKWVRHPMMTGVLVAVWVTPHMTIGHLVFALSFTTYIAIGTRMEERDLVKAFGVRYEEYRRTTPSLFPMLVNTTRERTDGFGMR